MHEDITEILITEEEILAKVVDLGKQISRDYEGKNLCFTARNRLHGNIQLWQHHPIQRRGPNSQRLRGTY